MFDSDDPVETPIMWETADKHARGLISKMQEYIQKAVPTNPEKSALESLMLGSEIGTLSNMFQEESMPALIGRVPSP